MSTEYFQPNQPITNSFANLDRQDRAGFEVKLSIFEEHVGEPKVWGLQERPKNWLPIEDEDFVNLPEDTMRFARKRIDRSRGLKKVLA